MGNKAVDRSLDIIDYISQVKECSLADISRSLRIPKASCFDIIDTLKKRDIIEYADIRAKTYRLSIKLYQIGCTVVNDMDVIFLFIDKTFDRSIELSIGRFKRRRNFFSFRIILTERLLPRFKI